MHTTADAQILFVDTPGLHRQAGKAMNRLMNRAAKSALQDADAVLFVSDATQWTAEDDDVLKLLRDCRAPVIALLNKIDRVRPREKLLDLIGQMAARGEFREILPISAEKGDNLDRLLAILPGYLPDSPPLFPEDMVTDRSRDFHVAEIIREKLTLMLHQELPYGLTVQVERFERGERGVTIHAVIWVERDSQKGIVVGKGGATLKRIGRAARLDLVEHLGCRVHLELWVRVKSNWADSEKDLLSLGFDTD